MAGLALIVWAAVAAGVASAAEVTPQHRVGIANCEVHVPTGDDSLVTLHIDMPGAAPTRDDFFPNSHRIFHPPCRIHSFPPSHLGPRYAGSK
jgi:hypothetical protein